MCCPKQNAMLRLNDGATQMMQIWGTASPHTCVLLCPPLWRAVSLTSAVILFALWLRGPGLTAAVFATPIPCHSAMKRAPCVHCLVTSSSLLKAESPAIFEGNPSGDLSS
ncbi:hypothetical protein LDENG_00192770 [Lucifuga dentata]|nr:hypothetical protein LDENG_00192770 [Lucifuga dentata]